MFFKRFSNAKKASNLPENISIIKNMGHDGEIEILAPDNPDPITLDEDNEVYFQYLLFKYLGE